MTISPSLSPRIKKKRQAYFKTMMFKVKRFYEGADRAGGKEGSSPIELVMNRGSSTSDLKH